MKTLLLAFLALTTTSLFAQKKADDVAKVDKETFDFGKIKQNVPATATIIITNIGTEPLIIEQAAPSCGCTASDYTKAPIAPGKTGYVKAIYNAAVMGKINKSISLKFAGVDDVKTIMLTGEVVDAATATTPAPTSEKKVTRIKKQVSAVKS